MKERVIAFAECVDALRIVPRLALIGFGWLFGYLILHMWWWYTVIPHAERDTNAIAFVGGLTTLMSTISGYVFKIYLDNATDWNAYHQRNHDGNPA